MTENLTDIDWFATAIATLASYALGALWFTPLFGRVWDRSIGFDRSEGRPFGPAYYLVPLVCSATTALIASVLVAVSGARGWADGFVVGLIIGVGFAVVSVNNAVAPNVLRPFLFGAVVGGYHLTGSIVVALTVVGLR